MILGVSSEDRINTSSRQSVGIPYVITLVITLTRNLVERK